MNQKPLQNPQRVILKTSNNIQLKSSKIKQAVIKLGALVDWLFSLNNKWVQGLLTDADKKIDRFKT